MHVYVCVYVYVCIYVCISTQYFQQSDTFCIIGITQNLVIWFGLQTGWLNSGWNTERRENKIWLEQVMKLIGKKN